MSERLRNHRKRPGRDSRTEAAHTLRNIDRFIAQIDILEFEGMGRATTISFGGNTINLLWDAAALAAPATFRATILQKPFPT